MGTDLLPQFIRDNYEVHEWKHACAILQSDFPAEWADILQVLTDFRWYKSWIAVGGGSKSLVSRSIDSALYAKGWTEKHFDTEIMVDGVKADSPTHSVDCYKNRVALEIEWNNKDPFFDRDLNNFRLLFDLRAVSVGIIITRCDNLTDIFRPLLKAAGAANKTKWGASTTHMKKLLPRVRGGAGGGCPLLVFGISKSTYVDDTPTDGQAPNP